MWLVCITHPSGLAGHWLHMKPFKLKINKKIENFQPNWAPWLRQLICCFETWLYSFIVCRLVQRNAVVSPVLERSVHCFIIIVRWQMDTQINSCLKMTPTSLKIAGLQHQLAFPVPFSFRKLPTGQVVRFVLAFIRRKFKEGDVSLN